MASRRSTHTSLTLLVVACLTAAVYAQRTATPGTAQGPGTTGRTSGAGAVTEPGKTADTPVLPKEATIMVRDTLTIQTLDQPGFSGRFLIDLDGTFDFPYIGRVNAAGKTVRDVIAELKRRLVPGYLVNPQIAIELEQTINKKVTVTGEVHAPSVYPFAGELSVLTALTKAGSVTDEAAENALVFRGGTGTGVPVSIHDLMNGQLANNLMLQDGDTVLVPKAQPVYVSGEVRTPGQYAVRHGMTVQQVIALAGGVTDKGKTSGIKIQRTGPNGKKADITVKDWKTEVAKPGDTIVVARRIL
jgi:polysaccharide export outer membrane protein